MTIQDSSAPFDPGMHAAQCEAVVELTMDFNAAVHRLRKRHGPDPDIEAIIAAGLLNLVELLRARNACFGRVMIKQLQDAEKNNAGSST